MSKVMSFLGIVANLSFSDHHWFPHFYAIMINGCKTDI